MPLKIFGSKLPDKKKQPYIIAIAAGKGGVGKSALTANLALALYRMGFAVGVIDADLYGPSMRRMLPENVMPEQRGKEIKPALSNGIEFISMAHFRMAGDATVIRAPIANGMISQFLEEVKWGPLDFLLIDFPPGTGDIQITLSQKARLTGALLVTTPQEVALMDVVKCMKMFEQVQIPIIGLVENMSYYIESNGFKAHPMGMGGGQALARETGHAFIGEIPLHSLIGQTLDIGRSLFEIPGIEAETLQKVFLDIAVKLVEESHKIKEQEADLLGSFDLAWKEMD